MQESLSARQDRLDKEMKRVPGPLGPDKQHTRKRDPLPLTDREVIEKFQKLATKRTRDSSDSTETLVPIQDAHAGSSTDLVPIQDANLVASLMLPTPTDVKNMWEEPFKLTRRRVEADLTEASKTGQYYLKLAKVSPRGSKIAGFVTYKEGLGLWWDVRGPPGCPEKAFVRFVNISRHFLTSIWQWFSDLGPEK